MSQYCTQCGAENDSDTKFCKSCGLLLSKQSEQFEEAVKATSIEQNATIKPMPLKMLAIFPTIWMVYHLIFVNYGVIMPETIAEAFGGAIVILGIPLIVLGMLYLIKKSYKKTSSNFLKHMLIGTIIMFFLAIAGEINNRMEQSAVLSISQSQDTVQEVYEDVVPTAEVASPVSNATADDVNYYNKAMSILEKDPQQAIYLLNQAIEINPINAHYYGVRGVAYQLFEKPKNAIKDYDKAISLSKNDKWEWEYYANRASAYMNLGNMQKAKKDANKACSLGNCSLKKEIAKWERENERIADEYAPAADVAPLAEEVQGTINE